MGHHTGLLRLERAALAAEERCQVTAQTLRSRAILLLTWSAIFFIQFMMSRREFEHAPLRVIIALLQVATIASGCSSDPSAAKISRPYMGAELNGLVVVADGHARTCAAPRTCHPHDIRPVFALLSLRNWNPASMVLLTTALPIALLLVMTMWIAARRTRKWQALDVATVLYGSAVLLFLCLLSGGAHPLDHVNRTWGEICLACTVFPLAMGATAVVYWLRAAKRTD